MQRFRFTLETLLTMRRRKEEAAKLELGRKRQAVWQAQQELAGLADELKRMQDLQKEHNKKTVDIVTLRHSVAFRHKMKLDMLSKGNEIAELQKEEEDARRKLVKATQHVRSLELIRERRQAEWRKEYNRIEQGFLDDVSGQGFIRRKHASVNAQNNKS